MVQVYIPRGPGITYGIWNLIQTMQEFPEQLVSVIRIQRDHSHSFIALFRDKGTVANFTALVNQWGTSWGPGSGGTGSYGFAQIMTYIEENNIELWDVAWNDWQMDYSWFTDSLEESRNEEEMVRLWSKVLSAFIWYRLPNATDYEPNKRWQAARETSRG